MTNHHYHTLRSLFLTFALSDSGQAESQTGTHAGDHPSQQVQLGGAEQEAAARPQHLGAGQPLLH